MTVEQKMKSLIKEELCASAIKIAHAHIDKQLDEVLNQEVDKFYAMFLQFENYSEPEPQAERPF